MKIRVIGILIGASLLICSTTYAAGPTSVKISASYSGTTGVLSITNRFNKKPVLKCVQRIRASVSYAGEAQEVAIRTLIKKRPQTKVQQVRISGVPAVVMEEDGPAPQLNLQTTVDCGSGKIVSDPVAVVVTCGRNMETVQPITLLRRLERKFATAFIGK